MGRKNKKAQQERRLAAKRRRKALYKAMADERRGDANSKRGQRKAKKAIRFRLKKHAMRYCGNAGCLRCHPDPNRPKYPNKYFARLAREAKETA